MRTAPTFHLPSALPTCRNSGATSGLDMPSRLRNTDHMFGSSRDRLHLVHNRDPLPQAGLLQILHPAGRQNRLEDLGGETQFVLALKDLDGGDFSAGTLGAGC